MTSMSYCRFENTLEELQACKESLDEIEGNLAELSESEAKAADRLIQLCRYIAEIHGDPETIND